MSVVNYSPAAVSIIVGGSIIGGLADGTGVTVSRDNPMWTLTMGMQGFGTRVKSSDYSGKVVLTLQQSSPSNDTLQAFMDLDENTGKGIVPVFIKDNSGRTLVVALTAWIIQPPQIEFAKELTNREWTLQTDNLVMTSGGNA